MLMLAACLLCCVYVILHVWLKYRRMLELSSKIPGMKTLPLIGNAHQVAGNNEHFMNTIRDITKNYVKDGYIQKLWLGPQLLFFIGDPRDADFILKTFLEKHGLLRFMRDLTGQGLIFGPVHIWKPRRKIVMPAFSKKVLDTFVDVFQEHSEVLITKLEQHVGKGPVNMGKVLNACTLDSISESTMGVQLHAQTVHHSPYLQAVEDVFKVISERISNVLLHPYYIFRFTKYYYKQKNGLNVIFNFTDEVIRKKRQQLKDSSEKISLDSDDAPSKRRPFLDLLIGLSGENNAFSDIALREEVLTIVVAGTDTSAVGIGFTLTMLGAYPHIQDRVYQELLLKLGDGPVNKDNISKLVFLEAVIKESMRLYPPVPIIARTVDKEVTLPSGRTLPEGCGAIINIFGLHRNEEQWGADFEEFRPERFLTEGNRHPCAYMPFSHSFRSCLGYQYAMMSMKTVISNIIRKFELKAIQSSRLSMEIMMRPTEGFQIELKNRA